MEGIPLLALLVLSLLSLEISCSELSGELGASSSSQSPPRQPVPAGISVKIRVLNQFVYDYLGELGLSEEAKLWKEYVEGPTFPSESSARQIPFFARWGSVYDKFGPLRMIAKGAVGIVAKPLLPTSPTDHVLREDAGIKIQALNQLVFQWLEEVGLPHVANSLNDHVKGLRASSASFEQFIQIFIQINFVRDWLQIMRPIPFEGCIRRELGPVLPYIENGTERSDDIEDSTGRSDETTVSAPTVRLYFEDSIERSTMRVGREETPTVSPPTQSDWDSDFGINWDFDFYAHDTDIRDYEIEVPIFIWNTSPELFPEPFSTSSTTRPPLDPPTSL